MREWMGSAAICINEDKEILMVRGINTYSWAVPSGGIEDGETPEQCCVREVREETGYEVEIIERLFIKETVIKGIDVKTYYFKVKKLGESNGIDDPDKTIVETEWMSSSEMKAISHVYPEDLEQLLACLSDNETIKRRV
ncbi:NUDIX domain-containing protein [Cytobacillus luteolus]|uniref:NUDIX domain-containing protein n=1 Tax=Litchfieldia luteola TaxID=682179 RepID=UPI001CAF0400|nr:NUDIX hydrolase [Cytobacillus luteolus]MBP1942515.1 ADP-ribose pyrophosphatase YjhB (NUDIX family) [Cytobacillus luteolus]